MTEQQSQATSAIATSAIPVIFVFVEHEGYNTRTVWPGPFPRKGETMRLVGRDITWVIDEIEWQINIDKATGTMERLAVFRLVEMVTH